MNWNPEMKFYWAEMEMKETYLWMKGKYNQQLVKERAWNWRFYRYNYKNQAETVWTN